MGGLFLNFKLCLYTTLPPPKLHDTDHAPNVADIVTRFIDLITKDTQLQIFQSGLEVITVNGQLPNIWNHGMPIFSISLKFA